MPEELLYEKSCGAVVFCQKDSDIKFLLVRERSGFWCFPKGHMEAGESEQETALREVKEETGITVKDIKYLGSDFVQGKELLMLTYLAYYESGEIEKSTEVEGAAWYNIEDALCELNEDSIGKRVVKKVLKEIGYEGTNAFRCEGNNCNV